MTDEWIDLRELAGEAEEEPQGPTPVSGQAAEAAAQMAPKLELEGGEGLLALGNTTALSGNAVVGYLRVQFVDVYRQLEKITEASSLEERTQISTKIRAWINALNTSGLIPLDFRVRTLRMLEQYLDVLTGEMRGVILRAYKVGVQQTYDQMRHATEKEKEIDADTVDDFAEICCVALELLVGYMLDEARHYRAPSPLEVRQGLEIIWMGLSVIQGWPVDRRNRSRIMRAAIQFELLRKVDFHSLPKRDIERLPGLLNQLVETDDIDIRAVRVVQSYKAVKNNSYLVSLLMKAHQRPEIYKTTLPASHDAVITDFSAVLRVAHERIEDIRAKLAAGGEAGLVLETEYERIKFLSRILESFAATKGRDKREPMNGESVLVHPGVVLDYNARFVACAGINATDDGILIDISDLPEDILSVGSIVTLRRQKQQDGHGVVRWLRRRTGRGSQAGLRLIPRSDYTALVTVHSQASGKGPQGGVPGFVINKGKEPFEVWVESNRDFPSRVYASINPMTSYPHAYTAILDRQPDESDSYRRFRVLKKDPPGLRRIKA
ncbi:MAG TPA: hypothetical protein VNH42_05680 [Mariprofundaceae bacterium]|nr:hypothetical protein [Mariprofundaceae bacterium]